MPVSIAFWLILFIGGAIALAYLRASLRTSTVLIGIALIAYTLFGGLAWGWKLLFWLIYLAVCIPLNSTRLRRRWLSGPALQAFRRSAPEMSASERTALEAGTVWWEGELFAGRPDWDRLLSFPKPRLSDEEQAFLDGPVEAFCDLLNEWQITHEDADLPPQAWQFIKDHRFFGLIIPKAYGGLEFSAIAHSTILARIASSDGGATAGSIVAVPNSLGPAELLLRYGTDAQKDHYLPRLARGDEIPCFALTSPWAGSDAGAIPDQGVVCRGEWNGEEVLGMRLTWDKRYITLAPVASVLGLAFNLFDPDGLLGDTPALGPTLALIPTSTPGVEIGRRHFPLNNPFMNGPTRGSDVFVPLDMIIGGPQMAGHGWRMLMESLGVGRGISLPSMSTGGAVADAFATGAYARIRRQFNVAIGEFEGIQEALARIGGRAYAADALRTLTAVAVDLGEKPSIAAAIAKYHCTEMARDVSRDTMDVHGGKGVMLGPSNYIGRTWEGTPIAITVEGANILTRSMMIFGQGAMRCHPWLLRELNAAADEDHERGLHKFDRALFGHVGHDLSMAARSVVMGVSGSYFTQVPGSGPTRRYLQQLNRYSANLALVADVTLALLGGKLKFRESLSARLGDVLSHLYIASAVLKRFEDDGRPHADLPFVRWACDESFHAIEQSLDGVLRHLPNRPLAWLVRALVFPLGRRRRPADDATGQAIARLLQTPGETRTRVTHTVYAPDNEGKALGLLKRALAQVVRTEALEQRLLRARKEGRLLELHPVARVDEALQAGVINADEHRQLAETYRLVAEVIKVDDFSHEELARPDSAPGGRRSDIGEQARDTNVT